MLSHTSGLGSYFNQKFAKGARAQWRSVEDFKPLVKGEKLAFEKAAGPEIVHLGTGFTWEKESLDEDRKLAREGWIRAARAMDSGSYDLLILDELNYVLSYDLLDVEDVVNTLHNRPESLHVIVTGRDAPSALIEAADLVTEMKEIKHYYKEGVKARDGIEK